jgi:hypothetical protein
MPAPPTANALMVTGFRQGGSTTVATETLPLSSSSLGAASGGASSSSKATFTDSPSLSEMVFLAV